MMRCCRLLTKFGLMWLHSLRINPQISMQRTNYYSPLYALNHNNGKKSGRGMPRIPINMPNASIGSTLCTVGGAAVHNEGAEI